MADLYEFIIISFLCAWGIATLFYQFKATSDYVAKWSYFSLIPRWTFFAPIPKTSDDILCYQDKTLDSETVSDPIPIVFESSSKSMRFLKFLWNPKKRENKAVVDIVNFILTYRQKHHHKILKNSFVLELYPPYLALLNYVSRRSLPNQTDSQRRFVILRTFGFLDESQSKARVFESHFHRLEPRP